MRTCKRPSCGKSLEGRRPNVIWCCRLCRQLEYERLHPQYVKAKGKRYRKANPDKRKSACAKWRADHPEANAEAKKRWHKANPECQRAYNKKFAPKRDKEKQKIYKRRSNRKMRGASLILGIATINTQLEKR